MAAVAKEIEGLGQPLSFESNHLLRGGGKETSAFEMVPAPFPTTASERVLYPKVTDPLKFFAAIRSDPGQGGKNHLKRRSFFPPSPEEVIAFEG